MLSVYVNSCIRLPRHFQIASLALGWLHDRVSANGVSPKETGKIGLLCIKPQQSALFSDVWCYHVLEWKQNSDTVIIYFADIYVVKIPNRFPHCFLHCTIISWLHCSMRFVPNVRFDTAICEGGWKVGLPSFWWRELWHWGSRISCFSIRCS